MPCIVPCALHGVCLHSREYTVPLRDKLHPPSSLLLCHCLSPSPLLTLLALLSPTPLPLYPFLYVYLSFPFIPAALPIPSTQINSTLKLSLHGVFCHLLRLHLCHFTTLAGRRKRWEGSILFSINFCFLNFYWN